MKPDLPRFGPVAAIAWRDLRAEMAGFRGLGLPFVAAVLLLPTSLLPNPGPPKADYPVQGRIPEAVLAVEGVRRENFGTGFRTLDGVVQVYAYQVPPPIRRALDGPEPVVRVEVVTTPWAIPKRSLLFALISASTLTGAVSGSIGGERSRNTLQALLSAAVTRLEIILGKWLAWSGFGAAGALTAGAAAVISGVQAPGPWLLALPAVPALTVAVALWLVRRTEDVIAGTSVTLRVLPALIGGAGLFAWVLDSMHPLLAASVPLGGALLASGDQWDGAWLPTLLSIAVTLLAAGGLLWIAARDLEQHVPYEPGHRVRAGNALLDGGTALGTWWLVVAGPVLWGWAGNAALTEALTVDRGLVAGTALLGMLSFMLWMRSVDPAGIPPLGRPGWRAGVAAVGLVAASWLPGFTPEHPWLARVADRLGDGLIPPLAVGLPLLVAQEVWFRGFMQTRAGPWPTALAWVVVCAPFDPLAGLVGGVLLGWAATEGLLSALLARVLAWGVLLALSFSAGS